MVRGFFTRRRLFLTAAIVSALILGTWVSALAHYEWITISPGTYTYVTGHYITSRTVCPDTWTQNQSDSITEYSATSVRFNTFSVYTYYLSGRAQGGPHWVIDNINSNNSQVYLNLYLANLLNNTYYSFPTGRTVGSAVNRYPQSDFISYQASINPNWCRNDNGGVYVPS